MKERCTIYQIYFIQFRGIASHWAREFELKATKFKLLKKTTKILQFGEDYIYLKIFLKYFMQISFFKSRVPTPITSTGKPTVFTEGSVVNDGPISINNP